MSFILYLYECGQGPGHVRAWAGRCFECSCFFSAWSHLSFLSTFICSLNFSICLLLLLVIGHFRSCSWIFEYHVYTWIELTLLWGMLIVSCLTSRLFIVPVMVCSLSLVCSALVQVMVYCFVCSSACCALGWGGFFYFDKCLFNAMCPLHSCTSNDVCLHVSFLVSFVRATKGTNMCILLAFDDSANSSLASLLVYFFNLCISATLLMVVFLSILWGWIFILMVSPAATFISSSAVSFPAIPLCPGTYPEVMFCPDP